MDHKLFHISRLNWFAKYSLNDSRRVLKKRKENCSLVSCVNLWSDQKLVLRRLFIRILYIKIIKLINYWQRRRFVVLFILYFEIWLNPSLPACWEDVTNGSWSALSLDKFHIVTCVNVVNLNPHYYSIYEMQSSASSVTLFSTNCINTRKRLLVQFINSTVYCIFIMYLIVHVFNLQKANPFSSDG